MKVRKDDRVPWDIQALGDWYSGPFSPRSPAQTRESVTFGLPEYGAAYWLTTWEGITDSNLSSGG